MADFNPTTGQAGAPGRVIITIPKVYAYGTPYIVRSPEDVPDQLPNRWLENILAAIDSDFIPGWADLLADETTYLDRLATPAKEGYETFLTPGVSTRRGRTSTFATHLHGK